MTALSQGKDFPCVILIQFISSRASLVMTHIMQYSQENEGSCPSIQQIRWEYWDHPLDFFILQLGVDLLKFFSSLKYLQYRLMLSMTDHLDHTNEILIVNTYYAMSNKLDETRRHGEWPISSYRLCKFSQKRCIGLASEIFKYFISSYTNSNTTTMEGNVIKLKCRLCSKANGYHRQTRYKCSTCDVTLCRPKQTTKKETLL